MDKDKYKKIQESWVQSVIDWTRQVNRVISVLNDRLPTHPDQNATAWKNSVEALLKSFTRSALAGATVDEKPFLHLLHGYRDNDVGQRARVYIGAQQLGVQPTATETTARQRQISLLQEWNDNVKKTLAKEPFKYKYKE